MRNKRSSLAVKEREADSKRLKRSDPIAKDKEEVRGNREIITCLGERDRAMRKKRNYSNVVKERIKICKYFKSGSTLQECPQIFNQNIKAEPVYLCTCFLQNLF